jgi:hypothetical protein
MSEMIERVAEALYRAAVRPGPADLWEEVTPYWQATYRRYAIAAIEAMREPTEVMLIGARDWSLKKNGQGVGNDQATGCWQAMLDAALTEDAP